jgi:putative Mg2+ transporter-C (MgtC) family protein
MFEPLSTDILLGLSLAALLGAILGFERERHGRPAGLRTHLLVSLGAAGFMVLSPLVAEMGKGVPADPGRIAAQIVSGIGFLGAGAIVKEGVNIRGLTTAACLWIAAAIGMTAGAGFYLEAILICGLAMVALVIFPYIESWQRSHSYQVLEITMPLKVDVNAVLAKIRAHKVSLKRVDMDRDYTNDTLKLTCLIRFFTREVTDQDALEIVEAIESLDVGLKRIVWQPR